MRKTLISKILINSFQTVLLFAFIFLGLVAFEYFQQNNRIKKELSNVSLYLNDSERGLVSVLGETVEANEKYSGDRFVAQDIVLGGESLTAMTDDDRTRQIEISHFQGKLFRSSEDKDDISYYASWRSNKPIFSMIKYKNDIDSDFQEITEDNFAYVHSFTLPNIEFSSVYKYVIQSKDRWGKELESEEFVFYTGPAETSFFQLLEESFNDIFGWTVGK